MGVRVDVQTRGHVDSEHDGAPARARAGHHDPEWRPFDRVSGTPLDSDAHLLTLLLEVISGVYH